MKDKSYRHTSNRILTVIIVLALVFGILFGGGFAILNTRIFAEGEVFTNKKNLNIEQLDDRADETVNVLVVGVDEEGYNTDVIMVVNINTFDDEISVLQIPRDTYIGDEVITGKINAVYSHHEDNISNIESLIKTINEKFKLSIDHYATITFDGFKDVIDIIGGIEINVPSQMSYGYQDSKLLEPGLQMLDGEKSLGFVRHRKSYVEGDLGRMKAQTIFLEKLVEKVFEISMVEATQVATKCFNKITTDLTLKEVIDYYNMVKTIDRSKVQFFIMDGTPITTAYNGYAIYAIDKESVAELLNRYFRPHSRDVSADELTSITDQSELSDYFYGAKATNSNSKTYSNDVPDTLEENPDDFSNTEDESTSSESSYEDDFESSSSPEEEETGYMERSESENDSGSESLDD